MSQCLGFAGSIQSVATLWIFTRVDPFFAIEFAIQIYSKTSELMTTMFTILQMSRQSLPVNRFKITL